jgi:hypothetical protein
MTEVLKIFGSDGGVSNFVVGTTKQIFQPKINKDKNEYSETFKVHKEQFK